MEDSVCARTNSDDPVSQVIKIQRFDSWSDACVATGESVRWKKGGKKRALTEAEREMRVSYYWLCYQKVGEDWGRSLMGFMDLAQGVTLTELGSVSRGRASFQWGGTIAALWVTLISIFTPLFYFIC